MIKKAHKQEHTWKDEDWVLLLDMLYPSEIDILYAFARIGNTIDDVMPYLLLSVKTTRETVSRLKRIGILVKTCDRHNNFSYEIKWEGLRRYCHKNFQAYRDSLHPHELYDIFSNRLLPEVALLCEQFSLLYKQERDPDLFAQTFVQALYQELVTHQDVPLG